MKKNYNPPALNVTCFGAKEALTNEDDWTPGTSEWIDDWE